MPFRQEAMYTVKVRRGAQSGWTIEYFRMSNRVFERAQDGYLLSQGWICDRIQERIEEEFGVSPGLIRYEDLTFMRRRVIPRSARRPPKMKAADPPRIRARIKVLGSRR